MKALIKVLIIAIKQARDFGKALKELDEKIGVKNGR